jgi:predicted porin
MLFKKSLIPAVVASMGLVSAVQAQSTVQVYGVLDLTLGSFQYSGTNGSADNTRVTKVDGNQMVTSFIGFKGVEDLGNGLKAGFVLESFLRPDTGASGRNDASKFAQADTFWSRAANVYLQGGFGKVTLGRQIALPYLQTVQFNPFGGSFGLAPAVRLTYGKWGNDKGDSGWSNAVSYTTPTLSGFSATAQAEMGEQSDKSERTSYALAVHYTSGPLAVAASWQTVGSAEAPKLETTFVKGQRQTFGLINASYDAGFAKFFAEYGQIENSGFSGVAGMQTSLYQLGASVPVSSSSKVLASYGASKEKATQGGTAPRVTHSILTVAYDYNLSKRTDTYVAIMRDDEKAGGYKNGYSYVLGLRHAF